MDVLKQMSERYDSLWKNIIAPQRQTYTTNDLGPKVYSLGSSGIQIERSDICLVNSRGQRLQCSYYRPVCSQPVGCVVYLHGNAGSRLEAMCVVDEVLPHLSLFSFDFAGAGISEGTYVTLGLLEVDDLSTVVQYIQSTLGVTRIAFWGRSMGAVTAVKYFARGGSSAAVAMCVDSGYTSISRVIREVCEKRTYLPGVIISAAIAVIQRSITNELGGKDIFSLDFEEAIKSIPPHRCSAIFVSAHKDNIVDEKHTEALYAAFKGYKRLLKFEGDHNTFRPRTITTPVVDFFLSKIRKDSSICSRLISPTVIARTVFSKREDQYDHKLLDNMNVVLRNGVVQLNYAVAENCQGNFSSREKVIANNSQLPPRTTCPTTKVKLLCMKIPEISCDNSLSSYIKQGQVIRTRQTGRQQCDSSLPTQRGASLDEPRDFKRRDSSGFIERIFVEMAATAQRNQISECQRQQTATLSQNNSEQIRLLKDYSSPSLLTVSKTSQQTSTELTRGAVVGKSVMAPTSQNLSIIPGNKKNNDIQESTKQQQFQTLPPPGLQLQYLPLKSVQRQQNEGRLLVPTTNQLNQRVNLVNNISTASLQGDFNEVVVDGVRKIIMREPVRSYNHGSRSGSLCGNFEFTEEEKQSPILSPHRVEEVVEASTATVVTVDRNDIDKLKRIMNDQIRKQQQQHQITQESRPQQDQQIQKNQISEGIQSIEQHQETIHHQQTRLVRKGIEHQPQPLRAQASQQIPVRISATNLLSHHPPQSSNQTNTLILLSNNSESLSAKMTSKSQHWQLAGESPNILDTCLPHSPHHHKIPPPLSSQGQVFQTISKQMKQLPSYQTQYITQPAMVNHIQSIIKPPIIVNPSSQLKKDITLISKPQQ